MSIHFDVSSVAHELDRLVANPHLRKLAVVLPLDSGERELAYDYLQEGPPYDLPGLMYLCAGCGGDFVNPVEWVAGEDGQRRVQLRCGACGSERAVAVTPATAALLEAAHEARVAQIEEA